MTRSDHKSVQSIGVGPQPNSGVQSGLLVTGIGTVVNLFLAAVKIVAGWLGHSYVLIADGIESFADVFSSVIVWSGLRVSVKPADEEHPFGHGKAEPIAAGIVSLMLLGAAVLICIQSIHEIRNPHYPPAPFTLIVLVVVVAVKELMFRVSSRVGHHLQSTAVKSDAWHHRSDALTSIAAFVGISIALIGGYAAADDWAALFAAAIIAWNGQRFLRSALDEMMDVSASPEVVREVERIATQVNGVESVEKARIRKSGLHLAMDIHVRVNGELSVREGHDIAHGVKKRLLESQHRINDVTIHIEPA